MTKTKINVAAYIKFRKESKESSDLVFELLLERDKFSLTCVSLEFNSKNERQM